jgi:hypothetical protein
MWKFNTLKIEIFYFLIKLFLSGAPEAQQVHAKPGEVSHHYH